MLSVWLTAVGMVFVLATGGVARAETGEPEGWEGDDYSEAEEYKPPETQNDDESAPPDSEKPKEDDPFAHNANMDQFENDPPSDFGNDQSFDEGTGEDDFGNAGDEGFGDGTGDGDSSFSDDGLGGEDGFPEPEPWHHDGDEFDRFGEDPFWRDDWNRMNDWDDDPFYHHRSRFGEENKKEDYKPKLKRFIKKHDTDKDEKLNSTELVTAMMRMVETQLNVLGGNGTADGIDTNVLYEKFKASVGRAVKQFDYNEDEMLSRTELDDAIVAEDKLIRRLLNEEIEEEQEKKADKKKKKKKKNNKNRRMSDGFMDDFYGGDDFF